MFGVGFGEIILIVIVALLVFGPDKLPELAKQVGKGMRELKKASNDLQNSFHEAVYAEEIKELREKYKPPQILGDPAAQPRTAVPGRATVTPEALATAIASAATPASETPAPAATLAPGAAQAANAASAAAPAVGTPAAPAAGIEGQPVVTISPPRATPSPTDPDAVPPAARGQG